MAAKVCRSDFCESTGNNWTFEIVVCKVNVCFYSKKRNVIKKRPALQSICECSDSYRSPSELGEISFDRHPPDSLNCWFVQKHNVLCVILGALRLPAFCRRRYSAVYYAVHRARSGDRYGARWKTLRFLFSVIKIAFVAQSVLFAPRRIWPRLIKCHV